MSNDYKTRPHLSLDAEYIHLIIDSDDYEELDEALFGGAEIQDGVCQFWGDDRAEYHHHRNNYVDEYLNKTVSFDFKKRVVEAYGIFKAMREYHFKWGTLFKEETDYDTDVMELYTTTFADIIWELIEESEIYKEEEREEMLEADEEEEEEEEVDSDTASDAETDEEN